MSWCVRRLMLLNVLLGMFIAMGSADALAFTPEKKSRGLSRHVIHYDVQLTPYAVSQWRLNRVKVEAPQSLTVSEEQVFAPNADIVWNGEPYGDRRAQTAAIVGEGVRRAALDLSGDRPVNMRVKLVEFHSLTNRLRYSRFNAGVHNITFYIWVEDAQTGVGIVPPVLVEADLEGFTGQKGHAYDAQGQTQKVRITNNITDVISGWLGYGPDMRRAIKRSGR